MKTTRKILALLLCLATLVLCGCTGTGNTEGTGETTGNSVENAGPLSDGKTLKLLAVTSSFGLNTTQFLYDICKAEGYTDVIVGRLYGSGCTLEKHVENAKTNANFYEYSKNSDGKWDTKKNIPMLYGLQDEDWDIIFVQQSADQSPFADSYNKGGDLVDILVKFLDENKTNPNAKFVWNMTWAFQSDIERNTFEKFDNDQMKMYQAILDTVKSEIEGQYDFAAIIPTGTAVQNIRTSFIGDNLTKDGLHLNSMGRVIAGYTLLSVLTDKPITEINLVDVTPYYDVTSPVELTEEHKLAIMEAVNNAIQNPYQVTASSYPAK